MIISIPMIFYMDLVLTENKKCHGKRFFKNLNYLGSILPRTIVFVVDPSCKDTDENFSMKVFIVFEDKWDSFGQGKHILF